MPRLHSLKTRAVHGFFYFRVAIREGYTQIGNPMN
jgi:hypothetical protein